MDNYDTVLITKQCLVILSRETTEHIEPFPIMNRYFGFWGLQRCLLLPSGFDKNNTNLSLPTFCRQLFAAASNSSF